MIPRKHKSAKLAKYVLAHFQAHPIYTYRLFFLPSKTTKVTWLGCIWKRAHCSVFFLPALVFWCTLFLFQSFENAFFGALLTPSFFFTNYFGFISVLFRYFWVFFKSFPSFSFAPSFRPFFFLWKRPVMSLLVCSAILLRTIFSLFFFLAPWFLYNLDLVQRHS